MSKPGTRLGSDEMVSFVVTRQKVAASPGGELAAHEPVWDGEGWGYDRVVGSYLFKYSILSMTFRSCSKSQRELAVATAGRESPSETQVLASVCDCRFTKR